MSHVIKVAAALTAVGIAVLLAIKFVLPSGRAPGPLPPPSQEAPGLPAGLVGDLASASDIAAPDGFREAMERHTGTRARSALQAALEDRARKAATNLSDLVEDELAGFHYQAATKLAHNYRRIWIGTSAARRATEILDELRNEQASQIADRKEEALALVDAGRYDAAREALQTEMEFEDRFKRQLINYAETLERLIRVREHESSTEAMPPETTPTGRPAVVNSAPSPPPALPGYPDPDVKRLADARTLFAGARKLFDDGRYQIAAKSLLDLVGYYGDLYFVKRRKDGVNAMNALARYKTKGAGGLFHATSVSRKGRRVKLTYEFESEDAYDDWEALATIPHRVLGEFQAVRSGVRGTGGSASYLHRAFFENDVRIRCVAKAQKNKTHGLIFGQHGNETRQLMWIVTNHWFTEGENYTKKRPGHAILMFGKGVNADVPVDSPDIGFIFRGVSIMRPWPNEGVEVELSFEWKGEQMAGEIGYKGTRGGRRGSSVGDDGRGMSKARPGLFVMENSVIYRKIVIEGKLHPAFENARVNELLQIIAGLD